MEERLVQKILRDSLYDLRRLLHGWIVVIDDKIFVSGRKEFIFETREKAVRALYSTFNWRAKHCYAHFLNTGDTEGDFNYYNERGMIYPSHSSCANAYKDFKSALGKRLVIKYI